MRHIDIFNFLNEKYPLSDACDFDNPGFLVGNRYDEVKSVLVTLDCELTAVNKAIELGCNLIISHHPIIYNPLTRINEDSVIYTLIKNDIAVISMHTNLDVGIDGVNDCLCKVIGLKGIETHIAEDGYGLRKGTTTPISADEFAKKLRKNLGGGIKYVGGKKPVNKVLVCSGSGGNYVSELIRANCDTLVSADIKHNFFIDAVNKGYSLFDGGHFATEDLIVEPLVSLIQGQFPNLSVTSHHLESIKFE